LSTFVGSQKTKKEIRKYIEANENKQKKKKKPYGKREKAV